MARPLKQGVDYFPFDVDLDQDDKLGMIIGEFDHKGEYAYTKLLCWIYKNEGYYTDWTEEAQLKFKRRYSYCGFSLSFVNEVVQRCIKWGLFDKSVFESFQVLTSIRIQETWLDATRKRTGRFYIPKYWLIKVNAALEPEEIELLPEVIDKVKESKEKEKKGEVGALAVPPPAQVPDQAGLKADPAGKKNAPRQKFVPPDLQQVKDYFLKVIGNPRKPGHWPADKCENEAGKFFDHYQANGWVQGKNKPIVSWDAACHNWIRNEREGAFSAPARNSQSSPPLPVSQKPTLLKIEQEINYYYDRYCEDPTKVTIISVDPGAYDHIKKAGLVAFSDDRVAQIKASATNCLEEQRQPATGELHLKTMKRFAVIEFFKDKVKEGAEAIFKI